MIIEGRSDCILEDVLRVVYGVTGGRLVVVRFINDVTVELGITVELPTSTDVIVEETVDVANVLEEVKLVEDAVWDVTVEISNGPFISMVIADSNEANVPATG